MDSLNLPQAWELADLPFHRLISLGRRVERKDRQPSLRIALLGDAATQHYGQALAATLKLRGWWPEIYEAEFDTIRQEILNPASELYRFEPEVVILFTATQALYHRFARSAGKAAFADNVSSEIVELWRQIRSRSNAILVQHNFVVPLNRPFGNRTASERETLTSTVARINQSLLDAASEHGVKIVDTEFQASYHGKRHWLDERLWCQAKQALSPSFIPSLVKNVSDTILVERGAGIKCVIVDLDNTMWGGILAEDGADRIEVGQTELGLAFQRFQIALLELKSRGVLLAVCSKNDQANVTDVLKNHPDMILRWDDFATVVANFGDKASNILAIREKLNLGLDSFVFLDDTAFERSLIRTAFPAMQVPELSTDPADFVSDLARWNLFEGRSATAEDLARLAYYQADDQRQSLKEKFHGLDDFIAELGMEAHVLPFDSYALPRVLQLVQRSNQFNLTTIRHSEADLRQLAADRDVAAFCIRLADRLGDNGIIATVILRKSGTDAVVDTWIMSCRVLGRRVEDLTVQLMAEKARELGCRRLVGRYSPTTKNGIVENLYPQQGFAAAGEEGTTRLYSLDLAQYQLQSIPIIIHEPEPQS
ncbi:HAD-IIIC family phosphatase [Bradyrhizobium sp. USDA 328]|uniref:HAD-IIIC family phosphatase n=1 Tax=unclassified Bradyrhizobium TaxID=2631580 RepID=UPI00351775DB